MSESKRERERESVMKEPSSLLTAKSVEREREREWNLEAGSYHDYTCLKFNSLSY